jgi:hypothetical protein
MTPFAKRCCWALDILEWINALRKEGALVPVSNYIKLALITRLGKIQPSDAEEQQFANVVNEVWSKRRCFMNNMSKTTITQKGSK